jgi:hypothetical protein
MFDTALRPQITPIWRQPGDCRRFSESVNGADGISDIEGKVARVSGEGVGKRASFKICVMGSTSLTVSSAAEMLQGTMSAARSASAVVDRDAAQRRGYRFS